MVHYHLGYNEFSIFYAIFECVHENYGFMIDGHELDMEWILVQISTETKTKLNKKKKIL